MTKILVLGDTHWGVRSDQVPFHDNKKLFLDKVLFPYILKNNIKNVVHNGDIHDKRKQINFVTADRMKNDFLEFFKHNDVTLDICIGNHDTFYKTSNELNVMDCMFDGEHDFSNNGQGQNVRWHTTASHLSSCKDVLLVPWICDDNAEQTFETIKKSKAKYVIGHLELQGFKMYKTSIAKSGLDRNVFKKFKKVLTGHFHHRSTQDNINYIGALAQYTWEDYNDPRGFCVLDTKTGDIEYIDNPYNMFEKIYYNSSDKVPDCANKYIKLIVENKDKNFDKFLIKLEEQGPLDIQIIDNNLIALSEQMQTTELIEVKDTLSIFNDNIEQLKDEISSSDVDMERLKQLIQELYVEAQNQ